MGWNTGNTRALRIVQGPIATTKPILRITPYASVRVSTWRGAAPNASLVSDAAICLRLTLYAAMIASVNPTPATRSPLSGRNKVASPPLSPLRIHQPALFPAEVDFIASDPESAQAVTRNVVGTSVKIVVT